MNKYELAKKITQLDGLTNEEKASLVELLRSQKKYGLVWEDKPEEIETRLVDELPVLTEVPERAIVSESPDAPNHILIEGDNLEALTALAYTHEGKIDVIYIDPPYNTGNKDFVYNDSFVDREDGYRHSKWLSFMNKRLQIAKSLLSSGGVIFISIDDNEQAQLKLLCDEIFGGNNFKSNSIIVNNRGGRDYGGIALQHDYILIYSNNKGELNLINDHDKKFQYQDSEGGFNLMELRNRNVKFNISNRPNLCYPFYVNPNNADANNLLEISLEPKDGFVEVYPAKSNGIQTVWRWGKEEKSRANLNKQIFGKVNRNGGYMIVQKYRKTTKMQRSIWDEKEFVNERGSEVLKEILTQNIFSYPKSVATIKRVLELGTNSTSTILDFFAGSGTTLHATMQLNAEDGGHRKCILVTNNENNICEEVTYERNKRVIQGYTTPKGEEMEGLHDNNLRYYRTNFLSRDKSVKNMRQLVRLATDMLCIKNDVYTEAEFCGKKINPNIARYFDNGQGNRMLVIYEERAIQLLVQLMAQTEDDGIKTMVYVFSPGADPYTDDFEDIAERVKLCALPSAIYEAYKRVLPKRKPKFLDEALQEMKTQAEAEANMQQTLDFGENDNMNEKGGEA
ncbi:site-specific DNA-methyltransferase [Prevotella sp.]|uniref:site-specific DNA-methyltransferase n=1 Tax=Prevotella sp. TaxID=59823 RepID=UPI00308056A3